LLRQASGKRKQPVAFVVAGHNGSGKTTLWNARLSRELRIPLINADRLTTSMLPDPDQATGRLPTWASSFRNRNRQWQRISQEGVRTYIDLVMEERLPFAFETVFSHWEEQKDGSHHSSKIEEIKNLQKAGYFVTLIFVGLVSANLSILRVQTRTRTGGHAVPKATLKKRFPRTQAAIGKASMIADMTLMFDNSLSERAAFSLVRAQQRERVLYDCRNRTFYARPDVRRIAAIWLDRVVGDCSKLV
jgi:predicted ABC-type ATPase